MKNSFKVGKKVHAASSAKNGVRYTGKVHNITTARNGTWYEVNIAPPRQPMQLKAFRVSQLSLA